jgi:archaellum biogenesis ATPase FlaH
MSNKELELISATIKNKNFRSKIIRTLNIDDFQKEEYKCIFSYIKNNPTEDDDEILVGNVGDFIYNNSDFPEEFKNLVVTKLLEAADYNPKSPEQIYTNIINTKRKSDQKKLIEKISNLYEQKKYKEVDELIRNVKEKIIDDKVDEYEIINWNETIEERFIDREKNPPKKEDKVSLGFKTVDKATRGGLGKCHIGLIVANTGVGKSRLAVHIGFNAFCNGYKVLHIVTENELKETSLDYDAKGLNVDPDILEENKYKEVRLELLDRIEQVKKIQGTINLASVPVGSDFNLITEILHKIGNVNLLIIDSLDHITTKARYESERLRLAKVYWDFKRLIQLNKCVGITTTQAPKDQKSKAMIMAEGVSESYDKARIASLVLTFNQSVIQKTSDPPILEGFIAKGRRSKSMKKFYLRVDYSTCNFEEIKGSDLIISES